jgi:hypothetical protein
MSTTIENATVPELNPIQSITGTEQLYVVSGVSDYRATSMQVASYTVQTYTGFTQSGAGAIARTVQSKLGDILSVKDFGAKCDGVTDDTASFQAAFNAAVSNQTIYVPGPTVKLSGSVTGSTNVFWECAATDPNGNPLDLPGVVRTNFGGRALVSNPTGTATDFATLQVQRSAQYSGGTVGGVNSGLEVDTTVGANVANDEWTLTAVMNNSATGGENVAIYGQGNRETSSTAATWAGVMEAREIVPIANPTTGLVGLEVDNRSNGTDSNNNRIGIDVVGSRYNTSGASTQIGYGVRVQNDNDPNVSFTHAFSVNATAGVGFDTSLATIETAALRMAAGQAIAFDANAEYQLALGGGSTLQSALREPEK